MLIDFIALVYSMPEIKEDKLSQQGKDPAVDSHMIPLNL